MTDSTPPKKSTDVVWHHAVIKREHRERQNRHKAFVLWFTGLSGSVKSTLAHAVEERLYQMGMHSYVLDGDNVRHGLNGDLGFSLDDRKENIRRIGEVAKLMVDAGVVVMTAFICPMRADRERVRGLLMPGDFLEIYCRYPLEVINGWQQIIDQNDNKAIGTQFEYRPTQNFLINWNTFIGKEPSIARVPAFKNP